MNSSIARLLLVAQDGGGAGGGQQLWDDYSSNYNYNHNNYDHYVAQSSSQLQGWEFSQPTNHNYTTPSLSLYNNNSNEDGVLSQLPNLASLTYHTSFQNPSSSGGGNTSSISSSASTCSLLYGNPIGSYFFDDILGPLVKRRHRSEHASAAFVPIAALSPSCQVLGCKSDLRFSKHYHRRHKVCELHSKAVSVVINGNPQRFCQQCSRFHSLSEFDDGKRSCRKRLADHNRRRRKPQTINSNTTTVVVATSSNSTSNDSSTNTTSSNTTTTTSTTNTTTDTTRTMSIAFRNNTTSSKSNHINDHLSQENKEKKGQSKEQIIHINYSSNSKSIGSILSLSGNQVELQSIPLQLHSPNVLSNKTTNNNNNGFFATTLQNHQKHHVEEKPHHHHIVEEEEEEEEEEDKKELLSEDYYFFSKSNNNGGNFEGLF